MQRKRDDCTGEGAETEVFLKSVAFIDSRGAFAGDTAVSRGAPDPLTSVPEAEEAATIVLSTAEFAVLDELAATEISRAEIVSAASDSFPAFRGDNEMFNTGALADAAVVSGRGDSASLIVPDLSVPIEDPLPPLRRV